MRKMVLDDASVWEYGVGKKNTVLKSPGGKKTIVHNSKVGFIIEDEDYYDEGWTKYEVTPFRVKQYILNNILGNKKKEDFRI